MSKSKVTEEQIVKVLRDPLYTSDRQRALALGQTPSGAHTKKFRELREKYGIPQPEAGKRGRMAGQKKAENQPGALRFNDIKKDDRLMRDGKRLIVVAIGEQGVSLRGMDGSIKFLHRQDFEKNAGEYIKVPPGDPQGAPVKTYIDPTLKLSAGDIKVNGQPIKNLPDEDKKKIVDKLKEDAEPRKPGMTINSEFEAAVQEMEAEHEARKIVPVHIDLEMEDSADPVSPFRDVDYTDSEWGAAVKEISDTILSHREYLDRINRLLDLTMPDCADRDIAYKVAGLAEKMLEIGITGEIAKLLKEAGA